ncbi:complement resistance protein TraT [Dyadobacter sp. LJ53]|uniref:complement resistance protein TraT n=1 Tax=Dyadobacter chenwenxiniae TaxID=2906456 RepID=UPI001F29C3A6|nr:complement resistance protein TraT [Dyadobacter chenwenxiniae]MCF0052893.1 complement resistance protein TraT [Dyadobacter chenwenxiniae]
MECKMNSTGQHKDDWDFVIAAAITSSFGGAVLGGSLFNMTGALIGGAVGIFVEIWPFLRLKNSQAQNKSL